MPIDVRLEDERGNPVATLDSPSWLTNWMLSCADLERTVCLRFIDPYGNTVFNRWQLRVLVEELTALDGALTEEAVDRAYQQWLSRFAKMDAAIREEALRYPKPSKSALRAHIESLRALAEAGAKAYHQYVRFIGD
jgi:hypothetical protein